jgi:hypothetical protein
LDLANTSTGDGVIDITAVNADGSVTAVHLSGIALADDQAVFSLASFASVFAAKADTGDHTPVTLPVAAGNTADTAADATQGDVTYQFAAGDYTFNIDKFAQGDKLDFLDGAALDLTNSNPSDGVIDLTAVVDNSAANVRLTGIVAADDAGVFSVNSFNTVFGAGSLA